MPGGASLSIANLSQAQMRQANLRGSSLHRANLDGANYYGAFLNKAKLTDVDLQKVIYNGATQWEGAYYDENTIFPSKFDSQQKEQMQVWQRFIKQK